jgi:Bacteriocin-protection, YdeI or OmpD-Associated
MQPKGQAQIDWAKADGRWAAAYAPQSRASPDGDLEAALDAEPSARALFDTLDSANRYSVLYRVHRAKTPEKRAAKIAEMVAKLARGETFRPRRDKPHDNCLALLRVINVGAPKSGHSFEWMLMAGCWWTTTCRFLAIERDRPLSEGAISAAEKGPRPPHAPAPPGRSSAAGNR